MCPFNRKFARELAEPAESIGSQDSEQRLAMAEADWDDDRNDGRAQSFADTIPDGARRWTRA